MRVKSFSSITHTLHSKAKRPTRFKYGVPTLKREL